MQLARNELSLKNKLHSTAPGPATLGLRYLMLVLRYLWCRRLHNLKQNPRLDFVTLGINSLVRFTVQRASLVSCALLRVDNRVSCSIVIEQYDPGCGVQPPAPAARRQLRENRCVAPSVTTLPRARSRWRRRRRRRRGGREGVAHHEPPLGPVVRHVLVEEVEHL